MAQQKLPHDHGQKRTIDLSHMPSADDFADVADVFRQMGDGKRVMIFWILCHEEECGTNIAAMTGMTPPAVAHHLKLLKSAGLVTTRRDGKEVYYRAKDTAISDFLHHMIEDAVELSCPVEK